MSLEKERHKEKDNRLVKYLKGEAVQIQHLTSWVIKLYMILIKRYEI